MFDYTPYLVLDSLTTILTFNSYQSLYPFSFVSDAQQVSLPASQIIKTKPKFSPFSCLYPQIHV